MNKLSHQQAGELGEALALAKLVSLGLHAYISPPGAPGHDIVVVTADGPQSIEVKTRQYTNNPSEISRWPVDMKTKADADFFLFVELNLRSLEPTFYLLNGDQAKAAHKDYSGTGNCLPREVRSSVAENDFSAITGESQNQIREKKVAPIKRGATPHRSMTGHGQKVRRVTTFDDFRIVQYQSGTVEVYKDEARQPSAIACLRLIAKKLAVSELNSSGNEYNTRQLGKLVIEKLRR